MPDGRGTRGERALGHAWGADGHDAGAFVARRDGDNDARAVDVVDSDGQQVLDAVRAATEGHVEHVHPVSDRGLDGVEDVLAASVTIVTGEDVVAAELGSGGHAAGVIGDVDAVDDGRGLQVAGDRATDVGAVLADRLSGVSLAAGLVVEDLRDDDLVVGEVRVAELPGGRETFITETRVAGIDTGVDDADLHARAGPRCRVTRLRGGAGSRPTEQAVDSSQVRVVRRRVEEPLQLHRGHAGRLTQRGDRRAIETHGDRVQGKVVFAGHLRLGGVGAQPRLEGVALGGERRLDALGLLPVELDPAVAVVDIG